MPELHALSHRTRSLASGSAHSLRHIDRVPLPGLALICGESLTPNRQARIAHVPAKNHDDRPAAVRVSGKEMANLALKRAHHRRVKRSGVAVCPVDAP